MKEIPSTMFCAISFPLQGKIITIDQLDFCTSNLRSNTEPIVHLIVDSCTKYKTFGVGLFKDSYLMGIFPSSPPDPPLTIPISMISTSTFPSSLPWDVEPHQDPSLSSLVQLSPLSSSLGEHISTSIHVSKNKKKWNSQRKHSHKGNPLASRNHTRDKLVASACHAWGTPLTFGHYVEKKHLLNGPHT